MLGEGLVVDQQGLEDWAFAAQAVLEGDLEELDDLEAEDGDRDELDELPVQDLFELLSESFVD